MTDKKIIAWAVVSCTNINEFAKRVDAELSRGMCPYGTVDVAILHHMTPLYTMTLYRYEEANA